jgi:hypothetical protein
MNAIQHYKMGAEIDEFKRSSELIKYLNYQNHKQNQITSVLVTHVT